MMGASMAQNTARPSLQRGDEPSLKVAYLLTQAAVFWDPRVLVNLAEVLEPAQRETFFTHIHEWHLLHKGQRVWVGRQHAQA